MKPEPGEGYALCGHDDPERTHYWHERKRQWSEVECHEGLDYFTYRKPVKVIKEGWISIKERLPSGSTDSRWLCFFNYGDSTAIACQTISQIVKAGTDSCLTHWMPLPNPPEPPKVESEGESLAEEYASRSF